MVVYGFGPFGINDDEDPEKKRQLTLDTNRFVTKGILTSCLGCCVVGCVYRWILGIVVGDRDIVRNGP